MASLRGGQLLWGTVNPADPNTYTAASVVNGPTVSAYALVGPGPFVAIYIQNTGATTATFKVQVSASDNPRSGINWLDTTNADGGVTWYDYQGATALSVAAGTTGCFDLAPFSPPLIRLVRTDTTGTNTIVALVSAFGPN